METRSPLSLAMIPGVKPIDFSKVNLAGVNTDDAITSEFAKAQQGQEDLAKSLEMRYKDPNWFKVSAGFLKPQLGGFGASLGSAAEAMGENTEQQRAVAPTVAQIRAQAAVMGVGLQQRKKGNELLNERIKKPGGMTSEDVADIAQYDKEIGAIAQQKFANQRSTFDSMLAAYQAGSDYTKLVDIYGKPFVDQFWPSLQKIVPGLPSGNVPKPTAGGTPPPAGGAGAPTAGGVPSPQPAPTAGDVSPVTADPNAGSGTRPMGVPASLMANTTPGQSRAATTGQIDDRVKATQVLQERYRTQAENSIPIFETTANLFRLAQPKYMAPAFAIFEGGDAMGVIGKALENQTVSGVLAGMRDQILKARMSEKDTQAALTNLQIMKTQLGDLQTKMQQGIINPTDARTMFEAASVPDMKNTQDAFLRGIAGIGSTALGRYEAKNVLQQFLRRPDADIHDWEDSQEYRRLRTHLEKRSRGVLENSALGGGVPDFIRNGLENTYRHRNETTTSKPKAPATSSNNPPANTSRITNAEALKAERARRGLPTN